MDAFLEKTSKLSGRYDVTRSRITFVSDKNMSIKGIFYYGTVQPWNQGIDHFYLFHDGKVVELDHSTHFELDDKGEYHLFFDGIEPQPTFSKINIFIGTVPIIFERIVYHNQPRLKRFNMTLVKSTPHTFEYKEPIDIEGALLTVYRYPNMANLSKKHIPTLFTGCIFISIQEAVYEDAFH
jgi:hypothetical protein